MNTNVSDFMDTVASDYEAPKPLPKGRYILTVRNYEAGRVPNEKQTPFVRVFFMPSAIVDAPEATRADLEKASDIQHDFWMSDKSAYRTKDWFSDVLGFEVDGRKFGELFEQAIGSTVTAQVAHEQRGKKKDFTVAVIEEFVPE